MKGKTQLTWKALALCGAGLLLSSRGDAQIADPGCKFLGNILGSTSKFSMYWNQVTPENAGKWGSVEATRNQMNWTDLTAMYDFARDNGYIFKQHNFVWGNQQPAWIASLDTAQQRQEVEEWIRSFCERFPDESWPEGLPFLIDVVNEPLHAPPTQYESALGGSGATGWDWVIWAFRKARQYCPSADLLLNEYNVINSSDATQQYLAIINLLKDRGLIDGIGVQGHYFELQNVTPQILSQNITTLGATGLPVYISELEIDESNDNTQLQKYKTYFPALWENPAVQGITLWGFQQGTIWKENGYLVRSDGTERPAMSWLRGYVRAQCGNTTGLEDTDFEGLRIYPNPVTGGAVTIEWEGARAHVRLIDASGRLAQQGTVSKDAPLTLHVAAPGLYLVRFSGDAGNISRKLLVR